MSENRLSDEDFAAIFSKPPKEAIAYLKAKGFAITWDWHEMAASAHQRAFTVAGLLRLDALEAVRQSLVEALANGVTYRVWVKGVSEVLGKQGLMGRHKLANPETGELKTLAPWRLRTIYQTNLQSSYMAGRWASMKEAADTHPYWQYVAVMDSRTRPAHARLNGLTFRHDDPFWDSFYPPLGYNCRCRVVPVSASRVRRKGIDVASSEGRLSAGEVELTRGLNSRTATVVRFEVAPRQFVTTDPGFNGSPAAAADALVAQLDARREAFAETLTGRAQ